MNLFLQDTVRGTSFEPFVKPKTKLNALLPLHNQLAYFVSLPFVLFILTSYFNIGIFAHAAEESYSFFIILQNFQNLFEVFFYSPF